MTKQNATRVDSDVGRFYEVVIENVLHVFASVTHILSCLNKGPALTRWMTRQTKEAVLDAVYRMIQELGTDVVNVSEGDFARYINRHLGDQQAHEKTRNEAALIGTQCHHFIDWYLKTQEAPFGLGEDHGAPPPTTGAAEISKRAWLDWIQKHEIHPLHVEKTIYSVKHRYAGTMDLLAMVDGKLTLLDWKTSSGIYPENFLQSVAYQAAAQELGLGTIERALIVRLPKVENQEVQVVETPPMEELLPTFLAVKRVFDWWHPQQQRKR